jgi:asparagine synthase (glutamine-hydrolysing)
VRRLVEAWPPSDRKVTVSFLLKRFVAGEDLDGLARHFLWTSNLPPALLQRLGVVVPATPDLGGERLALDRLLDLVQHCDLEYFLGEGLLTKADRASMQSAVELRAPFLDRSVMEFAATLPARERVRGLTTKVFLKRYALRYLPKEIVHRRKRGLSVPLARWLRGPLRSWAEDRLTDPRLAGAGLHAGAIERLHEEHQLRRADHARALWTLIVLDEWLRWTEDRQ